MAYLEPEPYSEPCYIQDLKHNPNSANICNRLVFENNANSFLHFFHCNHLYITIDYCYISVKGAFILHILSFDKILL